MAQIQVKWLLEVEEVQFIKFLLDILLRFYFVFILILTMFHQNVAQLVGIRNLFIFTPVVIQKIRKLV